MRKILLILLLLAVPSIVFASTSTQAVEELFSLFGSYSFAVTSAVLQ